MTFEFSLTPLQQRIVAIVLVLIPVAAVLALLFSYASAVADHRERIALLKRERAHYEALADADPAWSREVDRLHAATAAGDLVFEARTADDAARQLQAKTAGIVAAEGGTGVQSRAELNADGDDGAVRIVSHLSFAASIENLTRILFKLQQTRPLLIPTRLAVRSSATPSPGASTVPNLLQVDLAVVAYMRLP